MVHGIEKPRDVAGGLLVMAIGAGFLLLGRDLVLLRLRISPDVRTEVSSG